MLPLAVLINPPLTVESLLLAVLLKELPLKQAVSIACKLTKANKNELYETALKLKEA